MLKKYLFSINEKVMIRFLLGIIIILVFLGGYYNARLRDTERNYNALYVKYKQLQKAAASAEK